MHFKSEVDNGGKLEVNFLDEEGDLASGITITFKSRDRYQLSNCMQQSRPFDSERLSKENRLWTIEKRGYRIIVSCNGLRVLDVTASSETCTDDDYSRWGHTIVDMTFDRSKSGVEATFYHLGVCNLCSVISNIFKNHMIFHSLY